jgi:hypothetical protein
MAAHTVQALIAIQTNPVVLPQEKALQAGAAEASLKVDAVVSTATI